MALTAQRNDGSELITTRRQVEQIAAEVADVIQNFPASAEGVAMVAA